MPENTQKMPKNEQKEMVNHPSHYNRGKIEAIDVIEDWNLNFSLGSAVKYISRAGAKDDIVQDLKKAEWYVHREIERLLKIREEEAQKNGTGTTQFGDQLVLNETDRDWLEHEDEEERKRLRK